MRGGQLASALEDRRIDGDRVERIIERAMSCREIWTTRMVNASLISRLSQAVDQIENRLKRNRPKKPVTIRCFRDEDSDAARDRHFAAHPEDRDATIVVFLRTEF